MFSLFGTDCMRTCSGVSRREFLRIGSLALGGLSLPGLLASRVGAAAARPIVQDRSVVLLFLVGGPPQVETFDPKLGVPENNRSCTGDVATKLPGVHFGGTFPKLAGMADRLAVVRSFGSGDAGHNQLPVLTGNNRLKAPLGALTARALGNMSPRTGVPTNTVVVPESVRSDLQLGQPTGPFAYDYILKNYLPAGGVGSRYDAFLAGAGTLLKNLQLQFPRDQFEDRRSLLSQLDNFKRRLDRTHELDALDGFQQQAYDVLLKGIVDAFDISKEDPRTVARYDTSHLFRMEDYHRGGRHYNNLRNQSRVTNLLGKQMLLARRLCEAGAGFVTVIDSCWDFHGDGNNPPTPVGMSFLGPQLDHAVAAFLEDVRERGLSDKILLIVTGEMGRSPIKAGKNGGTGHHADLTPLLLAGGGLKMGQVVGASDKQGSKPATKAYRPEHLLATVLNSLFDASELRITPSALPAAVTELVVNGQPIPELF